MYGNIVDYLTAYGIVESLYEGCAGKKKFIFQRSGVEIHMQDAIVDKAAHGVAVDARAYDFGPHGADAMLVKAIRYTGLRKHLVYKLAEALRVSSFHERGEV